MPISEWPFLPDRLTDILSEDLLRFIQAGSAIHTKLPLAIVELQTEDGGKPTPHYIPMDDRWLQHSGFCEYFRGETEGQGPAFKGADQACRAFDCRQALDFFEGRLKPEPGRFAVEYRCHMGLWDFLTPIEVAGKCVAVILGGQRRPTSRDQIDEVVAKVLAIGTPQRPDIAIGTGRKETLRQKIDDVPPHSPDLLGRLEAEAERIGGLAAKHWELQKLLREEGFIRSLQIGNPTDERSLDVALQELLTSAVKWCRVEFACLFATEHSGDNVLKKFLAHGKPAEVLAPAPHFNWTKAGLGRAGLPPQSLEEIDDVVTLRKGVKGERAQVLQQGIAFLCPVSLASQQRAVFCIGRRTDGLELGGERAFLQRLASEICRPYLERREILELTAREDQWEDAVSLIDHQLRGSLTPISTEADVIRERIVKDEEWVTQERAQQALDRITKETKALAAYASEELDFWRQIMGRGAREFKKRPLPELVKGCVERIQGVAEKAGIEIRMDASIPLLPEVEAIGQTLEVAVRNVLENAIKYSFDERFIEVKGRMVSGNYVELDIDDFGIGIPEEEQTKVFDKRYRGKSRGRRTVKQGEGLGAWQAWEILHAHGGYIYCFSTSRRGDRKPTPGDVNGFKTTFTLGLPVEQKYRKEE